MVISPITQRCALLNTTVDLYYNRRYGYPLRLIAFTLYMVFHFFVSFFAGLVFVAIGSIFFTPLPVIFAIGLTAFSLKFSATAVFFKQLFREIVTHPVRSVYD